MFDDVATVVSAEEPPLRTSSKVTEPPGADTNVAVTLLAASIVIVVGLVEPARSPLHPLNRYPAEALAFSVTTVPGLYAPPGGFKDTLPEPTTFTVRE